MTTEEAEKMLDGFRRDAVSCTKLCTEGRMKERFTQKVECYSLAIKAFDGVETLGVAVEQALEKYHKGAASLCSASFDEFSR